jgi:glycosyltransferase involved in cell wall biosynthesis
LKLLVIIPAFNEQDSISSVVTSLKQAIPQADYVVINDSSTDNTEKICKDNHYNYISLPDNLGIGGGVQTGYKYALMNDYDIAVQMDGDGQHDPRYIKALIKPIEESQADMVVGSRFIEKTGFQSTSSRRLGINFLKWLIYLCCGVKVSDTTSGFRACGKGLIAYFAVQYAQDYPEPEAIIAAVINGFKIKEVPVEMLERQGGKSSINTFESIYYMIKVSLAIIVYRISNLKKMEG